MPLPPLSVSGLLLLWLFRNQDSSLKQQTDCFQPRRMCATQQQSDAAAADAPEGSSAPPFLFVRTVSPEGAGEDWRCIIKEVKEKLH